jgi:hypothetical protein
MMNRKGFGRKVSWRNVSTIPEFARSDCGIPRKTTVETAVVHTEIRAVNS